MNCRSTETKMSAYIDQELGGNDMLIVREHLTRCSKCQREFSNIKSIKAGLRNMKSQAPSEDFEKRLKNAIAQESRKTSVIWFRKPSLFRSMIATIVVTASVVIIGTRMAPKLDTSVNSSSETNVFADQASVAGNNPLGNPNSALLISNGD